MLVTRNHICKLLQKDFNNIRFYYYTILISDVRKIKCVTEISVQKRIIRMKRIKNYVLTLIERLTYHENKEIVSK